MAYGLVFFRKGFLRFGGSGDSVLKQGVTIWGIQFFVLQGLGFRIYSFHSGSLGSRLYSFQTYSFHEGSAFGDVQRTVSGISRLGFDALG